MSDSAPYEVTSATSQQAAESLDEFTLNRLEERVYRTLLDAKDGMTDEELEKALAMRHQTVSARRRELVLAGLVVGRGTRRGTSGRRQSVWHAVSRVDAKKPARVKKPKVVCLCGSTRFYAQFQQANYEETMAGRIVLTVGFYPHSAEQAHGGDVGCTPEQKLALDELHKRKIDLCDEVLVLNLGGYIGQSTRSEIEYAQQLGKPVRYLEEASA